MSPAVKPCLNCKNVGKLGELRDLARLRDTQAMDVEAQDGYDLHRYRSHSPVWPARILGADTE